MRNDILFLLQNNMVERLTGPVATYARERGHFLLDFSLTADFDYNSVRIYDSIRHVIVYGSVGWMQGWQQQDMGRYEIQYFQDFFDVNNIVADYREQYLNHGGRVFLARENIFALTGATQLHIRPVKVEKAVIGAVYTSESWAEHLAGRNVDDSVEMLASPVRQIDAEYRCFIIDGMPIEISSYRRDGKPMRERIVDPKYFAIALKLFETYTNALLLRNVVMDFAETPDGIKLIEFNPIHGSGWYECDTARVLDAWIASLT